MKNKLIVRSLLGAPIGVLVTVIITIIISLATGKGEYYPAPHELMAWCGSEVTAVIVQLLCALFVGALGGGSSVIWNIEKWSLLKQTAVHFAVLVIPYVAISYVLNWLPHNALGATCYCLAFVAVYVIMWLAIFFSIKLKIKKMNEKLRALSDE